jgi:hypothetical protein
MAKAGWFPDPDGTPMQERYWDGTAWSPERREIEQPATAPASPKGSKMGFFKQTKANTLANYASRARQEGRSVFVAQFRGAMHNSPSMSHPISDVAEMIEAVEGEGWRMDQFTSVPYKDNITVVALFRRT